jgi:hypothetical protein
MNRFGPHFIAPRALRPLATLVALACAGSCFGQGSLVGNSPFAPSGTLAASGKAADQDYELAGSSSEGSSVSVCIFARQSKHSEWIPVGETSDGIHVVSFDSSRDRAVVIVSGQRKEISMRTEKVASLAQPGPPRIDLSNPSSPLVPVANNPQAAAPAAVGTPEQQQREARMLVSDLLEIGVQQRKAYQDAKMKAAQGTAPAPAN